MDYATDTIQTAGGDLKITFIGHGTMMFTFGDLVIHIDPVAEMGDYGELPKADILLLTHDHPDHLDLDLVKQLRKEDTVIVSDGASAEKVTGCRVMKNGDTETVKGINIEAVPAYNLIHMRSPGNPFHPKGYANGYVMIFGDKKVYVASDTENIPELRDLSGVDVAFLPMNLPYTMTPEMAADAALSFMPKILYPYHFGETDTSKLIDLLKDHPEIEVRIREMQ